jgi:hypothetical protein
MSVVICDPHRNLAPAINSPSVMTVTVRRPAGICRIVDRASIAAKSLLP